MRELTYEDNLIKNLDDKRLTDIFLPAIKKVMLTGGGADQILKHSEVLAAVRLSTTAMEGSPETALKAAIEILNRVQGRPVERHINLFADISDMSEAQLDREIRQLAERGKVQEVVDIITAPAPKKPRKKRPSRGLRVPT